MQKKDAVTLLHHANKPSGKVAAGKPNTLQLLIPALTPHSQIKEMRHFLPASVGSRKPSFSQRFSTGKLKHHEHAISSEARLREKAQEENLKQATEQETAEKS